MRKIFIACIISCLLFGLSACADSQPADKKTSQSDKENADKEELMTDKHVHPADRVMDIKLNSQVPDDLPEEDHAFIVLGSALSGNGEMTETLVNRLKVVLDAAKAYPDSKVIVTGGVPQDGKTEADAMYNWLRKNGINKERLIKEDKASDTVENALNALPIAQKAKIKDITIITSASHMRRALVVFETVNREMREERRSIPDRYFTNIVYKDIEDTQHVSMKEKILIYRDYLRAASH